MLSDKERGLKGGQKGGAKRGKPEGSQLAISDQAEKAHRQDLGTVKVTVGDRKFSMEKGMEQLIFDRSRKSGFDIVRLLNEQCSYATRAFFAIACNKKNALSPKRHFEHVPFLSARRCAISASFSAPSVRTACTGLPIVLLKWQCNKLPVSERMSVVRAPFCCAILCTAHLEQTSYIFNLGGHMFEPRLH